jgi:hypothetical protein
MGHPPGWVTLFVGEDFHVFDLDFVGEEVGGAGHQGLGDFAGQVGVAACFVVEGVKDSVGAGAEFEAVPGYGLRFFVAHGCALLEEGFYFSFFARLCLQHYPDCLLCHFQSLQR